MSEQSVQIGLVLQSVCASHAFEPSLELELDLARDIGRELPVDVA